MRSPVQAAVHAAAVALLVVAAAPTESMAYAGCGCDMYILIEDSMRLGSDNFTALRDFAASFAGGYLISQKDIKVGLMSFGEKPLAFFGLKTATDTGTVVGNIGTFGYVPDEVVNWRRPVMDAQMDFIMSARQRQTLFLFVKGYAADAVEAQKAVDTLKKGGITVAVLSLGATDAAQKLLNATASEGRYVNVDDKKGLTDELKEELDDMLPACRQYDCPALPTTFTSTGSMTTPPAECECDIVFMMETTRRATKPSFEQIQLWVADLVRYLGVGPDRIHIGAVTYADGLRQSVELDRYDDPYELANAIAHLEFGAEGGKADVYVGLSEAWRLHRSAGGRPNARKFIVDIAHGMHEIGLDPLSIARLIKNDGINITVVGVPAPGPYPFHNKTDLREMESIASNEMFMFVPTVSALFYSTQIVYAHLSPCDPDHCPPLPPTFTTTAAASANRGCQCDFYFVYDSAASVQQINFVYMQVFAKVFFGSIGYNIDGEHVRVAGVDYGTEVVGTFPVTRYDTADGVVEGLQALPYSNMHEGVLYRALSEVRDMERHDPAPGYKTIVLFYDGRSALLSNTGADPLPLVKELRAAHFDVIVFQIENGAVPNALTKALVSKDEYAIAVQKGWQLPTPTLTYTLSKLLHCNPIANECPAGTSTTTAGDAVHQ